MSHYLRNTVLIGYCDYHPVKNHPRWGAVTCPKCQISNLKLSPSDNYRPGTIFWPCPKVVIISDKHCTVYSANLNRLALSHCANQSRIHHAPPSNAFALSTPSIKLDQLLLLLSMSLSSNFPSLNLGHRKRTLNCAGIYSANRI